MCRQTWGVQALSPCPCCPWLRGISSNEVRAALRKRWRCSAARWSTFHSLRVISATSLCTITLNQCLMSNVTHPDFHTETAELNISSTFKPDKELLVSLINNCIHSLRASFLFHFIQHFDLVYFCDGNKVEEHSVIVTAGMVLFFFFSLSHRPVHK